MTRTVMDHIGYKISEQDNNSENKDHHNVCKGPEDCCELFTSSPLFKAMQPFMTTMKSSGLVFCKYTECFKILINHSQKHACFALKIDILTA